ncbi:MAG: hypothetical protein HXY46_01670 [Syntrophaceae bacterium]|nr:hypothetical protein [Syntrophaceae bacterium]
MALQRINILRLSDGDLDFLIETAHPEVVDKVRLKTILREDEDFRNSFISDEKIFRRLIDDEEVFLKISPALFFEILLRKVADDLRGKGFTIEKTGTMKIPVFDTKDVVDFLKRKYLLDYLADMLSSFTRVETYTITFESSRGVWEKIRFNDLDMFSLMSLCDVVEDEHRMGFYKRIADICLFILGIFPDYAEREFRYPFSGQVRPQIRGRARISPEEYEKEGRRFYKLAAEHRSARELELSEIFWTLHEDFEKAKKPLNFIAEHYLRYKRHKLFA